MKLLLFKRMTIAIRLLPFACTKGVKKHYCLP